MIVTILTVLFVIICPLLIAVVLIQEPKGGGLAGVFGGSGASPFGAKTADVVMWVTAVLGLLFFTSTLVLGYRLRSEKAVAPSIEEPVAEAALPVGSAVPAAAPGAAASSSTPAASAEPGAPAEVPAPSQPSAPPSESGAPASEPAAPSEPAGQGQQ